MISKRLKMPLINRTISDTTILSKEGSLKWKGNSYNSNSSRKKQKMATGLLMKMTQISKIITASRPTLISKRKVLMELKECLLAWTTQQVKPTISSAKRSNYRRFVLKRKPRNNKKKLPLKSMLISRANLSKSRSANQKKQRKERLSRKTSRLKWIRLNLMHRKGTWKCRISISENLKSKRDNWLKKKGNLK